MKKQRLEALFNRYIHQSITEPEENELMLLLADPELQNEAEALIESAYNKLPEKYLMDDEQADTVFSAITGKQKPVQAKRKIVSVKIWRYVAAASVFAFLLTAYLLFVNKKETDKKEISTTVPVSDDVQPGKNKAILTLADGKKIVLDSSSRGLVAQQGYTEIKYQNGQVIYNESQLNESNEVLYNILSTANGESYSLLLADGSKVWLNAASSVRFPVSFIGKERRVEITGEAFFKVAKNPAQPFIVSVNGMDVQAFGTEFNVNAYTDEATINTTLIEGSVKVSKEGANSMLQPGQQSKLDRSNRLSIEKDINVDEIMAWKEGFFHFESADLKTILRQFARWYNVEVIYEGEVKNRKFFGIVHRSNTLKQVLEMLKDNDIIYSIRGKTLVVKAG